MDDLPVKPAAGFRLMGTLPDHQEPLQPPKTIIVYVNGIRNPGLKPQFFPDVHLPSQPVNVDFIACVEQEDSGIAIFKRQVDHLLSEVDKIIPQLTPENVSIAIWADDIGGTLVKQVFSGTPHRGSLIYSFHTAVQNLIQTGFPNVLGDWFPKTSKTLSRHMKSINQGFRHICHNFSIINYYERPSPSDAAPFQVLLLYECATLSVPNEINIGVNRTHDKLRILVGTEAHAAHSYLLDATIKDWNEFQYIFDLLQPASPAQTDHDVHSQSSWHPSANLIDAFPDDSGLSAWLSDLDGPRYLTISPRTNLDPRAILSSLAQAIYDIQSVLHISILFLHVACEDVQILQDIDYVLGKTEAKVQMVLLAVPGLTLGVEDDNIARLHGLDDALEGPAVSLNNDISERTLVSASQGSNMLRKMLLSQAALETALLGTLQSFLPELGRQETLTLTWIAFATRPFNLQELDWAIAQDQAQKCQLKDSGTKKLTAFQLVTRLQVVLPGLLEIKSDNRVVQCISYSKVREILSKSRNNSLGEEWSPHLYLAETCLGTFRDATALNEFAKSGGHPPDRSG
ncbi:uncharacterized protein C8A04DRAFT_32241, partial [Dichotomopilus funicola]